MKTILTVVAILVAGLAIYLAPAIQAMMGIAR